MRSTGFPQDDNASQRPVEVAARIRNARQVLFGKQNDLNARRVALSVLQNLANRGASEAADAVTAFTESEMSLEDRPVVTPYSPTVNDELSSYARRLN